ncbi:MAG: L,D-transpeptidase family protein [Desulfovermiculus sp.]|nr:L,D-transpeptidase family protein [Desulfovermiculus sp.]
MPLPVLAANGAYSSIHPCPGQETCAQNTRALVGILEKHTVDDGETLLDIARDHGLGYLELHRLYPDIDPWLPPVGRELTIPRQWILPEKGTADIVINLPELRLYHFIEQNKVSLVQTYPLGIGKRENPSPVGTFPVGEKRKTPYWYIPISLQEKYGTKIMAPGPENPLGNYWIGLGRSDYGLHGTNIPWSVGRLATHGCIRLYPEHIRPLFDRLKKGHTVQIIYEPVKLGVFADRVYAQAYPDIYGRLDDYLYYAYQRLTALQASIQVDLQKFRWVLEERNGFPTDISKN